MLLDTMLKVCEIVDYVKIKYNLGDHFKKKKKKKENSNSTKQKKQQNFNYISSNKRLIVDSL